MECLMIEIFSVNFWRQTFIAFNLRTKCLIKVSPLSLGRASTQLHEYVASEALPFLEKPPNLCK
jgi:hypothetical protein